MSEIATAEEGLRPVDPNETPTADEGPVVRLFREEGTAVRAEANAPVLLEDPDSVWMVVEGRVNVFAVDVVDEEPEGARDYLFTVEAGGLLPGVEPAFAEEVGLLAVGTAGTRVQRLPLEALRNADPDVRPRIKELVDDYVLSFSSAVSERSRPQVHVLLSPGGEERVEGGRRVSAQRRVAWTRVQEGELRFAAVEELAIGPDEGPFPLATRAWAETDGETAVRVLDDAELLEEGAHWQGLRSFQRIALEWADAVLEADRRDERQRLQSRLEADKAERRVALQSLSGVIREEAEEPVDPSAGLLLTACRLVGRELDVEFDPPPSWEQESETASDEVRAIARASGVRHRRVVLTGEWWTGDNGPLLGFVKSDPDDEVGGRWAEADVRPVALLPEGPSAYEMADPATGRRETVDAEMAQELEPFGYQFYRSLPARALSPADLWSFVTTGIWSDLRTIVLMGLLASGLSLLLPVLTGTVFDTVIPSADSGQLVTIFAALVVATLAKTAFQLTRSFAVIRFHTRVKTGLQMAVLDRLIRLPMPFFRKFTAGDLGNRARGISVIGKELGGATIESLLSALVSAGAFFLLFYYSIPLALLATAILVVNVGFMGSTAYAALDPARRKEEAEGRLSGMVLELLTGISKLRVAGAETRAFSRWSKEFRTQQELGYRVGQLHNRVKVFNSALSIVSTLALYWAYVVLIGGSEGGLSTGQFLAFNAAFGMFMGAGQTLTNTAIRLIDLIPTWERSKPILETVPEVDEDKPDPGELTGRIEVSHLSFRYSDDGPLVLDDVSLEAEPGEFIALVGPSGAGKSTLLRILLGFDLPESSSVYYDGHDLAGIDVTAVRRQIGVVLQSSRLTQGDIFSNIVGNSSHTLEDAWEAARMAGLEEDLEQMPMGMHTVISEGGGTLSGGQRQRLLIARALVRKPRILFFDEATSALDNRAQKRVSQSIDKLHATRVVIAHRLSTIRNADRIYVLEDGRLVQSGTFDELREQPGLFADLAARQEA